jgi:hypothetical protein
LASHTPTLVWASFAIPLISIGVVACGQNAESEGHENDSAPALVCAPGDQKSCACPGGSQGAQRCDNAGRTWGPCLACGTVPSPDAGPVGGADAASPAPDTAPKPPTYVNIEILSVLLGPSKSDGTSWDASGTVPSSVTDGLAAVLRLPGTGEILNFMASAAVQALSKPDPIGTAQIDVSTGFDAKLDRELANDTNNTEDTFEPTWPGNPGWSSVMFSTDLKVRVKIKDADLVEDDDVGVATLVGSDIYQAWLDGRTYWVRVDEQTNRQLLAVAIQVTTAPAP